MKVAGPTPSTVTPIVAAASCNGTDQTRRGDRRHARRAAGPHDRSPRQREDVVRRVTRDDRRLHRVCQWLRLESGAVTLTDATGGGDTVRVNVAGPTPSTVTPIVALPGCNRT